MDSFTIKGENGFIKITIDEVFEFPDRTCHWGGYDVKATAEIKSGNFYVKSSFYTSTGEIFQLYESLRKCNKILDGTAIYKNYGENIFIIATYDSSGHAKIEGSFSEENELFNKLDYEFNSDQSYINYSIKELELIASKYGDMNGVKKR